MNVSCRTFEGVMLHIRVSHVAHMNESWHTCIQHAINSCVLRCAKQLRCIVCMSHVAHMNGFPRTYEWSCCTYEWVMSHIWLSSAAHTNDSCHVTHMTESCLTYEWVMSHIWLGRVAHMNETCRTYDWVILHIWMSHVTQEPRHTCNQAAIRYQVLHRAFVVYSHVAHFYESCRIYDWVTSRRSYGTTCIQAAVRS